MASESCQIVIGAESTVTRRQWGPTAWAVFEELLLASVGDADGRTATTSVRDLAAHTGLAKDTVAHALTRLRRTGAISAHQTRAAGAFAADSYGLSVPAGIEVVEVVEPIATDLQSTQWLGASSDGACELQAPHQPCRAELNPTSPAPVAAPSALPAVQLSLLAEF